MVSRLAPAAEADAGAAGVGSGAAGAGGFTFLEGLLKEAWPPFVPSLLLFLPPFLTLEPIFVHFLAPFLIVFSVQPSSPPSP